MKIALFNDTGNSPHAGCQAVSNAHAAMLGKAGHKIIHREFVQHHKTHWTNLEEPTAAAAIQSVLDDEKLMAKIDEVDAVIVNGEGTIHHGNGYHLLAILGAAQTLHKQTLLVNAVFEETEGFDDVLSKLLDFTLRDVKSYEHAIDRGFRCRLVWDSSLAAEYNHAPLTDFAGQTIVTDWHGDRNHDTGRTALDYLAKHRESSFYFPLISGAAYKSWKHMPASFAQADMIISGRHHANYFACKAGTPFICMPSNSHKIQGFIDLLEEDIPFVTDRDQLTEAYKHVIKNKDMYKRIKEKVESQLPLTIFNRLGTASDSTKSAELKRLDSDVARARKHMMKLHLEPFKYMDGIVNQALTLGEPLP